MKENNESLLDEIGEDKIEDNTPVPFQEYGSERDTNLETGAGNRKPGFAASPRNSTDSGDDDAPAFRTKKRVQRFADSDSESAKESEEKEMSKVAPRSEGQLRGFVSTYSDNEDSSDISENVPQRSRLRVMSPSVNNTESESEISDTAKNKDQESRIQSKRNKLTQKFKSLISSRKKETESENDIEHDNNKIEHSRTSYSSDDEAASIENIKKIIKEKLVPMKSTIYDPDTSDEEGNMANKVHVQKKGRKSTKPTLPKPMRMSAKQAMENMQKIKSESNRMLREKDVSLPYHRPKALSLKDIMSRRRPAVTADGKALPIKMNEEQLKQYVELLDHRQKEIMELCKSDTDEETQDNDNKMDTETQADLNDTHENKHKSDADINVLGDIDQEKVETTLNVVTDNTETNENSLNIINASVDACLNSNNDLDTDLLKIQCNSNVDKSHEIDTEEMSIKNNLENNIPSEIENKEPNGNNSADMELVYNDSVEDAINDNVDRYSNKTDNIGNIIFEKSTEISTEVDSQLISLHYGSETFENNSEQNNQETVENSETTKEMNIDTLDKKDSAEKNTSDNQNADFSDDEVNMDEIDALIENAVVGASQNITDMNSPMLIKDNKPLISKPKLMGGPGMVIDLDGTNPMAPKKLSGVELLKERFLYFAKLKTPEESERDREKRIIPGAQHLKLKQELEEQIAEQRSLEWTKRLEDEKQQQKELNTVIGDDTDDIEKLELELEDKEEEVESESSGESDEDILEEDQEIVDKPRKRNPMVDDEAEESDCDDIKSANNGHEIDKDHDKDIEEENDDDADDEEESEQSSEESEESESEQQKPKKGRILKAFEDSDDEDSPNIRTKSNTSKENETAVFNSNTKTGDKAVTETQDDDLQLAQVHKSLSDDLFTSQESQTVNKEDGNHGISIHRSDDKGFNTQTFSILEPSINMELPLSDKLSNTQPFDGNLDAVVGMCSGSFSQTQNLVTPSQYSLEVPESQVIGEDVLALCTGQFYDNQFVSQLDDENTLPKNNLDIDSEEITFKTNEDGGEGTNIDIQTTSNRPIEMIDSNKEVHEHKDTDKIHSEENSKNCEKDIIKEDDNLKSILDELKDPDFDTPKPNKYFIGSNVDKENKSSIANAQLKKKFIIDSDDEDKEDSSVSKKKKKRKRKLEQRALQISDDEDEQSEEEIEEEYESAVEDDEEKIVEYDSDENEVVVQVQHPKKKRKANDFFEQEAELTSEDEWVGSGDEDEAGLDRMEREAGDDDTFNQNKLQRELGQIHMRDVLDQDKREVRLIQELLFEDGDLGGGHRQRKFRWRDADGEDDTGVSYDETTNTQEEEFESEEQWRKQRHEREMFLKSLENQEKPEEALNISVSRTSIIKANLSNTTSSLFVDMNTSIDKEAPALEKKTAKDIPSPKKPFAIFQQNYHGSLLTRGRGALARLAALATPLANDDDTQKVGSLTSSNKRNFVFAALDPTPKEEQTKVAKRKAESNVGTPKLVKKMKKEDKQKYPISSLLDHLKT